MADILILGTSPKSKEGKEFFQHSTDLWWDILKVINNLLKDRFPVETYFIREYELAPPAPVMIDEKCQEFSKLLEEVLHDGSARRYLRNRLEKMYQDDPDLQEHYGDIRVWIERNLDERLLRQPR